MKLLKFYNGTKLAVIRHRSHHISEECNLFNVPFQNSKINRSGACY